MAAGTDDPISRLEIFIQESRASPGKTKQLLSHPISTEFAGDAVKGDFLKAVYEKVPVFLEDTLLHDYEGLQMPKPGEFKDNVPLDSMQEGALDYLVGWVGEGKGQEGSNSIVLFNARNMQIYQFEVGSLPEDRTSFGNLIYGVMRAYPQFYDSEDHKFRLFGEYALNEHKVKKKMWKDKFLPAALGADIGGLTGTIGLLCHYASVLKANASPNPWYLVVPLVLVGIGGIIGGYIGKKSTDKKSKSGCYFELGKSLHNAIWDFNSHTMYSRQVAGSVKQGQDAIKHLQG